MAREGAESQPERAQPLEEAATALAAGPAPSRPSGAFGKMSEVRKLLGNTIAYFCGSNYGKNLLLERAATRGPLSTAKIRNNAVSTLDYRGTIRLLRADNGEAMIAVEEATPGEWLKAPNDL